MPRLFLLAILLAFAVTNGLAAPMALCQHADASAHALALKGGDTAALAEEAAAEAAEKQSSLIDSAAVALTAVPLPGQMAVRRYAGSASISWPAARVAGLAGWAHPPLLEPPSA